MRSATMLIEGMTCGGCVVSVKRVLERVPGVSELTVEVGEARLIVDDALVVRAGERRSQADNRRAAEERMLRVLDDALQVDPRRVSTAPTQGSRERRLQGKQRQAERKQLRRAPGDD
jgi:copper chaperone CopZ